MASVIFLSFLITILYVFTILKILGGWTKMKEWKTPENYIPKTKVSVIVPARNEEGQVTDCLHSILSNDYPEDLLKIIVVDDHSEDNTANLVNTHFEDKVTLLSLTTETGKKAALTKAVEKAKGELIITTDADCIVKKNWIRSITSYFEYHKAIMITAPVIFQPKTSLLSRFQFLDIIGVMAATAFGINSKKFRLANGANMAYKKAAFNEVGGYGDNSNLASGDDIFLVHKMAKKYPDSIHFLKSKEAIVTTAPEPSLRTFLQQRKRWAGKTRHYTEKNMIFLQALVFCFDVLIIITLLASAFIGKDFLLISILMFIVKMIVDYFFLNTLSKFYKEKNVMKAFLPATLLHVPYIIYTGITALFPGKFKWKGRTMNS